MICLLLDFLWVGNPQWHGASYVNSPKSHLIPQPCFCLPTKGLLTREAYDPVYVPVNCLDKLLISNWCASAGCLLSLDFPELIWVCLPWALELHSFSSHSTRIYGLEKRHEPQLSDDGWSLFSSLESARLLRPKNICTGLNSYCEILTVLHICRKCVVLLDLIKMVVNQLYTSGTVTQPPSLPMMSAYNSRSHLP